MKKLLLTITTLSLITLILTGCTITNPLKSKDKEETTTNSVTTNKQENNKTTSDKEYNIGEEVTINGEAFYVFEKSDKSKNTVTLFAKYNLTKDGKKQAVNAKRADTVVTFSSEIYWLNEANNYDNWDNIKFDLNTINGNKEGDAITKARNYAKSLGATNGRLITYEEVEMLKNDYPVMIGGQENQVDENASFLDYYTSSVRPFNIEKVYMVRGEHYPTIEVDSAQYGVRPIITIDKSLIK